MILFATDASLPAITEHAAKGGQSVVLTGQAVELLGGSQRDRLLDLGSTLANGRWRGTLAPESLLAAVAAAIGLGLSVERLRAGIQSYVPELARMVPSAIRGRPPVAAASVHALSTTQAS